MNDLEDRLTDLLTRSAAAVDIRPDLAAVTQSPPSRARRRYPYLIGLAAAGVALLVAATQLLPSSDEEPTRTTGPTTTAPSSSGVPRYLFSDWAIRTVDESPPFGGEMTYDSGNGPMAQLAWYPEDRWDERLAQWGLQGPPRPGPGPWDMVVSSTEPIALWLADGYVFEVRANGLDVATFETYLVVIDEVDEETWLAQLPSDLVTPAERPDIVTEALAQLPLPDGFDGAALEGSPRVGRDVQAVRTEVTDAVICAWIDQWIEADDSGDRAAKAEAVAAMGSWRQWPTIPGPDGPWGQFVGQVADGMAADQPAPTNGEATQGQSYLRAVGCPED